MNNGRLLAGLLVHDLLGMEVVEKGEDVVHEKKGKEGKEDVEVPPPKRSRVEKDEYIHELIHENMELDRMLDGQEQYKAELKAKYDAVLEALLDEFDEEAMNERAYMKVIIDKAVMLERATQEKAMLVERARRDLHALANKMYASKLGKFCFEIDLLKVDIKKEFIEEFAGLVKSYNAANPHEGFIEEGGSIDDNRSINCLWRDLFSCIKTCCGSFFKRRVLYKWRIFNPTQYTWNNINSIDFAFIRSTDTHLAWGNYLGGLELNFTPSSAISSPLSSSRICYEGYAIRGKWLALSRAAMCVLDRWKSAKEKEGSFRAYCCYADSCQLGVARVTFHGDSFEVTAELMPEMDLPGIGESNNDNALRLLVFLLTSEPEEMPSFLSLPFPSKATEISSPGSTVDPWQLGAYMGLGGSAAVYKDCENSACVIKVPRESHFIAKIKDEMDMLRFLHANGVKSIPTVVGELLDNCLKLSPLGIPVYTFVSHGPSSSQYCELIVRLGPVLVDTIQSAHRLGIAHGDIRRSNILILPSNEQILEYIDCMIDYQRDLDVLMPRLSINECSFILNDWGEASRDVVNQKLFIQDLRLIVDTMIRIDYYVTTSTPCSDKNVDTAGHIEDEFRIASYGKKAGGRFEIGYAIADSMDYDGLRSLFSGNNSVRP